MRKVILLLIVFIPAMSNSFSQDTLKYITSSCLQTLKSGPYYNDPPIMIGFYYSNDSLSISGMIGANCGSSHIAIVEKINDTIFITTEDTGKMATCDCEFNFEFKIKALITDTIVYFNGNIYVNGVLTGLGTVNRYSSLINLYPNPTDRNIKIDNRSNIPINKIEIFDVTGRHIKTLVNERNMIDMNGFNSGLYLIEIESAGGLHFFKKIIKK